MERREFLAMLAATPVVPISNAEASAQGSMPAAARKPSSITLLGTGTPSPSLDRQSSGDLIEAGHDLIVWDHGPGAHHRLLQSGHRSADVTHAFFTHLHYDHCMEYGRLVLQRWDQGADRIADLEVYGPPPIARMTEQLFGVDGIYGPDIRARIEHKSSQDQFEARGGTLPRRRPAPKVTEIHAGSVIRATDGRPPSATRSTSSRISSASPCASTPATGRSVMPATAVRTTPSSNWRRAATS